MHSLLLGIQFSADEGPAVCTISELNGWLAGGVGVRREDVPRPHGHGSFITPTYRTARTVTQQGLILTDSPQEQRNIIRHLSAVLAGGETGTFTVQEDPSDVTFGTVQVQKFDATKLAHGTVAKYRLELYMPIPMIYGAARTFAAGEPASHRGTFDAVPQLYVTGSWPNGYTVAAGGKQFIVTQALTAGVTHRIDMETGWLYRNGVLQAGAVSRADTWVIPRGADVMHTLTGSGSGALRVEVRDTYM